MHEVYILYITSDNPYDYISLICKTHGRSYWLSCALLNLIGVLQRALSISSDVLVKL